MDTRGKRIIFLNWVLVEKIPQIVLQMRREQGKWLQRVGIRARVEP